VMERIGARNLADPIRKAMKIGTPRDHLK
jgi:hypothetical protein